MKFKKVTAAVVATVMAAMPVFADPVADITVDGFWSAHTPGLALNEGTTSVTCTTKFVPTADLAAPAENWQGNLVVVAFDSEDGLVHAAGDAGYTEYFVARGDNWAWNSAGDKVTGMGADTTFVENEITTNWDNYKADLANGIDYTITVNKTGSTMATTVTSSNGMNFTINSPAASYIALTGEHTAVSNINYTAAQPATGDVTPVVAMAALALMAGAALVASKKFA